MFILATGTITQPARTAEYMGAKFRVLAEIKASSLVRISFRSAAQPKFVAILEADSGGDAEGQLKRLPFVEHSLIELKCQELIPLQGCSAGLSAPPAPWLMRSRPVAQTHHRTGSGSQI
ncbi:hypothetical protein [Streptomyces sp. NBC_01602]|uniref:hypothetical protein n=1 Tax=Streptomyces sp. NBC_01602 TaxID=2975893 RepID=UPI003870DABA|nr:hypothetical protein OG955_00590 [Streptomyces sp. NBC_01602]